MSAFKDLTNQRFGRLTAAWPVGCIRRCGKSHGSRVYWLCFCECGKFKYVESSNLTGGKIRSCGCWRREHVRLWNAVSKRRHGHASRLIGKTSEYQAYTSAKQRCINSRVCNFEHYGGRGIKFLFKTFEEFYRELGPKPSPQHSLDRIDNDGHYERGNVRWATPSQQAHNRRHIARRKAA